MTATELGRSRPSDQLPSDEMPIGWRTPLWRVRMRLMRLRALVVGSRLVGPEPSPYVEGVTRCGAALWRAGLLGTVASVAIFLGATQQNSPFTEKEPGAWFFGIPAVSPVPNEILPPGQGLFLGVVAVYGGMLLMLKAWSDLAGLASRHRGIPVRRFVWVFAAWAVPMLVVAPLFSKDVYSYVAQGEQVSHGISPYLYGPNVLGATTFSRLVDPMWGNVGSPYGSAFLALAGAIVSVTGHHELLAVVGMRLFALLGVILFAIAVPVIARSFRRDAATAFVLAALNPLVLFHLIAGAHNDALMVGLLAGSYALARRGHPVLGALLCGVAAAVKVPALLGAVYIGWDWLGPDKTVRERLRPTATALVASLGAMTALTEISGLGWGWIGGLSNPDSVWSWMDPPTAIGLGASKLVSLLGFGDHTHVLLTVARGSGLVAAALVSVWLLLRASRIGSLNALGWSFIAIVVLSPVVQPWYMTWGLVFLAPVVVGRARRILVAISAVACFVGLPSGHTFWKELLVADPLLVAAASLALCVIAAALVAPRARRLASLVQLGGLESAR